MVELIDVDRVKGLVNNFVDKRLKRAVAENDDKWKPPILQSLLLIQFYKILRIVLIILVTSYFIGIVWYIMVCDVLSETSRTEGFAKEDWLN